MYLGISFFVFHFKCVGFFGYVALQIQFSFEKSWPLVLPNIFLSHLFLLPTGEHNYIFSSSLKNAIILHIRLLIDDSLISFLFPLFSFLVISISVALQGAGKNRNYYQPMCTQIAEVFLLIFDPTLGIFLKGMSKEYSSVDSRASLCRSKGSSLSLLWYSFFNELQLPCSFWILDLISSPCRGYPISPEHSLTIAPMQLQGQL